MDRPNPLIGTPEGKVGSQPDMRFHLWIDHRTRKPDRPQPGVGRDLCRLRVVSRSIADHESKGRSIVEYALQAARGPRRLGDDD